MYELERFFEFLDLILARLAADHRGRPATSKVTYFHSHAKILKLLLLTLAQDWSLRELARRLTHLRNTLYRHLLGIRWSELPHWTTIARRRRRLAFLRFLRRVLRALIKEAIVRRPADVGQLIIDLTDLPTDPDWDRDGRWGRVTEEESFYGWKLHLIVNRKGVILAAYLTPAEKTETVCVTTLLVEVWRKLPIRWRAELIRMVIGDGAYDDEDVHRLIHELFDAQAAIELNPRATEVGAVPKSPHRRRTWAFLQTEEGGRAVRLRPVIERTNRTLKEDLGLEERLGAKESWTGTKTGTKIGVEVWLALIRHTAGRVLGMRAGKNSEGVKAHVF